MVELINKNSEKKEVSTIFDFKRKKYKRINYIPKTSSSSKIDMMTNSALPKYHFLI